MKSIEAARTYGDVISITVDVQNDFALPSGSLSVTDGEAIISPTNALNDWVREHNGDVVFTQDYHPEATAHFAINGGTWPIHCVQETQGAQLHDGLIIAAEDRIVHKGMSLVDDGYSGFEGVIVNNNNLPLASFVAEKERAVATRQQRLAIIIGGLATDFCDKATALDALALTDRDTTDVIIATDAMRAVNLQPHDGDAAIAAMIEAGAIAMTTEEIRRGGIVIDTSRLER